MKTIFFLGAVLAHNAVLAQEVDTSCKSSAALAIQSLAKINRSPERDFSVLLSELRLAAIEGPVETYVAGAYNAKVNRGSDDYTTCQVMDQHFSGSQP